MKKSSTKSAAVDHSSKKMKQDLQKVQKQNKDLNREVEKLKKKCEKKPKKKVSQWNDRVKQAHAKEQKKFQWHGSVYVLKKNPGMKLASYTKK